MEMLRTESSTEVEGRYRFKSASAKLVFWIAYTVVVGFNAV
jgi:hypothetical protein